MNIKKTVENILVVEDAVLAAQEPSGRPQAPAGPVTRKSRLDAAEATLEALRDVVKAALVFIRNLTPAPIEIEVLRDGDTYEVVFSTAEVEPEPKDPESLTETLVAAPPVRVVVDVEAAPELPSS